jgi:hypothetical protein
MDRLPSSGLLVFRFRQLLVLAAYICDRFASLLQRYNLNSLPVVIFAVFEVSTLLVDVDSDVVLAIFIFL